MDFNRIVGDAIGRGVLHGKEDHEFPIGLASDSSLIRIDRRGVLHATISAEEFERIQRSLEHHDPTKLTFNYRRQNV
jgi:hypothetical protein